MTRSRLRKLVRLATVGTIVCDGGVPVVGRDGKVQRRTLSIARLPPRQQAAVLVRLARMRA